jgi:hypothetical protein
MPAKNRWEQTGSSRCALVVIIAVSAISLACTPRGSKSESAATNDSGRSSADKDNRDKKTADSSAPDVAEVQAALARVYQDTVTIDRSQSKPVLLGDFNGDGSPDLAVVVKPSTERSLLKLNSEYANWIVEDPRRIELPNPSKAVQQLPEPNPPPLIKSNDVLLLVLHGYGESGWHHSYARQTFLLCNAVGENLQSLPLREVLRPAGKNSPSRPESNAISERLSGHDGFLYWTNGKYVWHQ